jgi:hypothetical protein
VILLRFHNSFSFTQNYFNLYDSNNAVGNSSTQNIGSSQETITYSNSGEYVDVYRDTISYQIQVEDGNAKPSARWVGRVLSKIELFKKKRVGVGVKYSFDSISLDKYMKARGWYNKELKDGENND